MVYNYIVIGAGASGLFFAANTGGAPGLILEKTARVGTKLLMSGGGHCNITHGGSIKDFISHYGENGKLIRRTLYKHNNLELINWLAENGIHTITEEDDRVFPSSKDAHEILDLLVNKAQSNGFEIKRNSPVVGIEKSGDLWRVHCAAASSNAHAQVGASKQQSSATNTYTSKHIIIATGGCSYPKTGSDGSIFEILKRDLDLSITDLTPALSPIKVTDYPYSDLSGISIDGTVTIAEGVNRRKKSTGAILFTHDSLSGPAIINISGSLSPGDKIKINYLGVMNYQDAFTKLQGSLIGNKSQLATVISDTFNLPKRFCKILADRAGGSTKMLAHLLTEDEFAVTDAGSFDNAMVTRGGISLDEIDLSTMELKKHPGIFAVGEALDIDGETGGYNLQFAYSSAMTAQSASL